MRLMSSLSISSAVLSTLSTIAGMGFSPCLTSYGMQPWPAPRFSSPTESGSGHSFVGQSTEISRETTHKVIRFIVDDLKGNISLDHNHRYNPTQPQTMSGRFSPACLGHRLPRAALSLPGGILPLKLVVTQAIIIGNGSGHSFVSQYTEISRETILKVIWFIVDDLKANISLDHNHRYNPTQPRTISGCFSLVCLGNGLPCAVLSPSLVTAASVLYSIGCLLTTNELMQQCVYLPGALHN
jgi:hypothetical protein